MKLKKTCILLLLVISSMQLAAQKTIAASPSDVILLNANVESNQIQWQQSNNASNWQNIESGNVNNFQVTLTSFPIYFRARVNDENCNETLYTEVISVINVDSIRYWSNPASWLPNGKPVAGEVVTIPEGSYFILDENTPNLGGLVINGTLLFEEMDLELTSEWIAIHGTLQVGSASEPFSHHAIITLTDTDTEESHMGMGTRGIMLMNGLLELHGVSPEIPWTKINAHAPAGSTSIQLMEDTNWNVGDEIIIGPTDYYNAGNGSSVTQRVNITGINGNEFTLNTGLNAHRWGLLQYATNTGMSLTPTNVLESPLPDGEFITPKILDERAPVGNLTRNIVIQAPDDNLWRNQGFGVHVMIMPNSTARVEGVEIKRGGQRGRLRRYPFHWHMLSYAGTETFMDASGQYIRNSSVNSSANRGIVIHGTNRVVVQNNVLYNIQGHGIFTEDAVERHNIIDRNLVLHVRNPPDGSTLKRYEAGGGNTGSSGFWISNPDNVIINNMAGDCEKFGFWLSFPSQPFGSSNEVLHSDGRLMSPNKLQFGTFTNNTAHSNASTGIMMDFVEVNEAGNVSPSKYESTITGRAAEWPYESRRRFDLIGYSVWKNGAGGIWDRSDWVNNFSAVNADNASTYFAGAGFDGVIERCLAVGTSLNHRMNGTERPGEFMSGTNPNTPPAFATYHSTFDIKNNIAINFPLGENNMTGVFATDDYYIRAVEKGQIRNVNNIMINSHPGYKMTAPEPHYAFAGALWDPHGMWGPAGNYVVYIDPFFTYGLDVIPIEPGPGSGGVSVQGPFYGFDGFVLFGIGDTHPQNQPWLAYMELFVRRLDNNLNEVGTWHVERGYNNTRLPNMRHFAGHPSGIYEINFPDENLPTDFNMTVTNMETEADTILISVPFNGSLNPIVQFYNTNSPSNNYTRMTSLQDVRNSQGETFWQDTANDKVWVKLRGGRWVENTFTQEWEHPVYKAKTLRIYEPQ